MAKPEENNQSALYEALVLLCKQTIEKSLHYKEQGKLEAIPYQSVPVKEIDYRMEIILLRLGKARVF